MKITGLILTLTIALLPAWGQAQDTGAEAFEAGDFDGAQRLWDEEAEAGSIDAMLGLGLLADQGLNGVRDLETATFWYERASELGSAEAQFNLALIYDTGIGVPRDPERAMVWYARAALRGYARAQYNLGVLYENGDGVPMNLGLAKHWFDLAAPTLPDAAEKSLTVARSDTPAVPNILFSEITDSSIELVWDAGQNTLGQYLLEVVQVPNPGEPYSEPRIQIITNGSGIWLPEVSLTDRSVWRVTQLGETYLSTAWAGVSSETGPLGRINLVAQNNAPEIRAALDVFAQDLRAAGYWVRVVDDPLPPGVDAADSFLNYGFETDSEFGQAVAEFLPGFADKDGLHLQFNDLLPGEIMVHLAGKSSS